MYYIVSIIWGAWIGRKCVGLATKFPVLQLAFLRIRFSFWSLLHVMFLIYFLLQLTYCCCSTRKTKNFAPGSFSFAVWTLFFWFLLLARYNFIVPYTSFGEGECSCWRFSWWHQGDVLLFDVWYNIVSLAETKIVFTSGICRFKIPIAANTMEQFKGWNTYGGLKESEECLKAMGQIVLVLSLTQQSSSSAMSKLLGTFLHLASTLPLLW